MKLQQFVLKIVLSIEYFFVCLFKIKKNRISFISLEGLELKDDQKLIYDALDKDKFDIHLCTIHYGNNGLKGQLLYFLNCFKQLYLVNTSRIVIIRDNNYVVSNFKREGVICIQTWHACGAIKKFGNAIERKYPIKNYDYILSTSSYWKKPYSLAFGVKEEDVLTLGMPRLDELFNADWISKQQEDLYTRYPSLKDKKIILYAPTFRGNIYKGFTGVDFDADKILKQVGEEYVILFKFHPLMDTHTLKESDRVINMNKENTHALFTICDYMISDYSSIVFDYMILNKPMLLYVPDLEEYGKDVGYFVDLKAMGYPMCYKEEDIINAILNNLVTSDIIDNNLETFFTYKDGNSTQRILDFINSIL